MNSAIISNSIKTKFKELKNLMSRGVNLAPNPWINPDLLLFYIFEVFLINSFNFICFFLFPLF